MSPLPNNNSSSISTVICLCCGLIVMIIVFVVCKIRSSRQQKKAAEEGKINAAEKSRAGNEGIENKMDNIENKKGRRTRPLARSKQRVGDIGRSDNVRTNHIEVDGGNQQQSAESSRKESHSKTQPSDSSGGKLESQKIIQRKISSHNNDIEEIPLTSMD
ncbi:hypothetical protein CHS0354_003933 [Potamilus streckersoni]|uniref:Uncharacterized protein n=1 Tax=Potamilus streckersoni TaxID=2493646 RepID=A0AAE0S3F2_9BIVA|nr:hypothetical protein CHS0354_003933 [Potamilus streckersoni]